MVGAEAGGLTNTRHPKNETQNSIHTLHRHPALDAGSRREVAPHALIGNSGSRISATLVRDDTGGWGGSGRSHKHQASKKMRSKTPSTHSTVIPRLTRDPDEKLIQTLPPITLDPGSALRLSGMTPVAGVKAGGLTNTGHPKNEIQNSFHTLHRHPALDAGSRRQVDPHALIGNFGSRIRATLVRDDSCTEQW